MSIGFPLGCSTDRTVLRTTQVNSDFAVDYAMLSMFIIFLPAFSIEL